MLSFARKQINSPTLYQGAMLLLWKYQSSWKNILGFQKKLKRPLWAPITVITYWTLLYFIGALQPIHICLAGMALGLFNYNTATKKFITYYFPIIITAAIYNGMGLLSDIVISKVHVSEPYMLEKSIFGFLSNSKLVTPNEFFTTSTNSFLDAICCVAYLFYAIAFMLFSFFLYGANLFLWVKKLNWAWLIVSILGFITYHIYSAAPPWYVAQYGLGPADLSVTALSSPFHQIISSTFLENIYINMGSIFSSMPALYISYPFIALFIAFQIGRFRTVSILWSSLVSFSALYLNQHYVIDILLALLYALITVIIVEKIFTKRYLGKS